MNHIDASIVVDSKSVVADKHRLIGFELEYPSVFHAELMSNRGLSITAAGGNIHRPLSLVRSIATATEERWRIFFATYGNAAPQLWSLVRKMEERLAQSTPMVREFGSWHLPYIDESTIEDACLIALETKLLGRLGFDATNFTQQEHEQAITEICLRLSVVRCHLVSNLAPTIPCTRENHLARMKFYEELLIVYEKLRLHFPLTSAFEHQAQPDKLNGHNPLNGFNLGWACPQFHGNLAGWRQNRMMFIEPTGQIPLLPAPVLPETKEQANG